MKRRQSRHQQTTELQKIVRIEHNEGETVLDASTDGTNPVNFTGMDPESGAVALTTSGADGGLFSLTATAATNDGYTSTLAFKAKPDFESPTDANKDNVYEVTVVGTDGNGNSGMKQVTVKVTNVEEAGKVTLPGAQPQVGTAIMAALSDSDIVSESSVAWQWYRLPNTTVPDPLPTEACTATSPNACLIKDAVSDSYTPTSDDGASYLLVSATYLDSTSDATAGFSNTATSVASLQVKDDPANSTPKFTEGASDGEACAGEHGCGRGFGGGRGWGYWCPGLRHGC